MPRTIVSMLLAAAVLLPAAGRQTHCAAGGDGANGAETSHATALARDGPDSPHTACEVAEGVAGPGRVWYVAPGGDDSNPGTEAAPWATVQRACSGLEAGDTVYLRGGHYPLSDAVVVAGGGCEAAWVALVAYPGEAPVLDFSGHEVPRAEWGVNGPPFPHDYGALMVRHGSYVHIEGLTVVNAGGSGIQVRDSSHVTVRRCDTHNTFSSGVSAFGGEHIVIERNEVRRACQGGPHGCITVCGVTHFVVSDNEVHDSDEWGTGGEGIEAKGANRHGLITRNHVHDLFRPGIYVDGWTALMQDLETSHNVVHDCANGIVIAAEGHTPVDDIRVHHNQVHRNRATGVVVSPMWGDDALRSNISITNNTVHGNGRGGPWPSGGGGIYLASANVRDVVIRNNICTGNRDYQVATAGQDLAALHVAIDHNLGEPFVDRRIEGRFHMAALGDEPVRGDPLYMNAAAGDFRLAAGSPAIDAGHPGPQYNDPDGSRSDLGALPFAAAPDTARPVSSTPP
jgi:hypothetical protein